MIEPLNKQWNRMIAADSAEKRGEFLTFCIECIRLVDEDRLDIQTASYHICGAWLQTMDHLTEKDEETICDVACDLELPKNVRASSGKEWKFLVENVEKAMGEMKRDS